MTYDGFLKLWGLYKPTVVPAMHMQPYHSTVYCWQKTKMYKHMSFSIANQKDLALLGSSRFGALSSAGDHRARRKKKTQKSERSAHLDASKKVTFD